MSEKNSDITEKIPSPSLTGPEEAENNSSREAGFASHWDSEEFRVTSDQQNRDARMRQSSWDNSDNDSFPELEKSPEPRRLYSYDSTQLGKSIIFEINELKKKFFETLEKMRDENDTQEWENLQDKIEFKLNSDRRQSPARLRRRTKSSSSLSPTLESKSHNSPEKIEKLNEPEIVFEEIPTKILEFDPKFYLNNFFTEIRSRRISLIDSIPGAEIEGEPPDYEDECIQVSSEMISPETNNYLCKISRKLSKILEIEENRTDLEKSSEEKIENSELFSKTLINPQAKHFYPLQIARSKKSPKILENIKETKTKEEEKLRSMNYKEFDNSGKKEKPFQGSLSERSTKTFNRKVNDNFMPLTARNEKTPINSLNDKKFILNPTYSDEDISKEPNLKIDEKEKSFGAQEHLNVDLMKDFTFEDTTPRKNTDRSERTHTSRSLSAKSRRSINPDSPIFPINIGKDSDRSLRVEDITTPDSSKTDSKVRIHSGLKTSSLEDYSPSTSKKYNKSTDRTEDRFEPETETNQKSQKSSKSVKSSYCSSKNQDESYLKSDRDYHTSHKKKNEQKEDTKNENFEANVSKLTSMVNKAEKPSLMENSRSCENLPVKSCRSKSFIKMTDKDISDSFENQSSFAYSRNLKSDKRSDLKEEDDDDDDQNRSQNDKIFELGSPSEVSGELESAKESCRSAKTIELKAITKESDPSENNSLKHTSRRVSGRSLNSRSKNTGSRRLTPRSSKMTSRSNSGNSSISKDSLENHDYSENVENLRMAAWKELERICDTMNSHTPVSSASSRSSWRELEMPNQQNSYRKKLFGSESDGSDTIITPKNEDRLEEQSPRSKRSSRSSRKSPNSQVMNSLENNNSDRSIKTKLSPVSWNSKERKITDIHSEIENLNIDAISEKRNDKFFIFKEGQDEEKSSPIQKYESETEKWSRSSNKRLSIINEVSFENLKIFTENEDETVSQHSGKCSKRSDKQLSPQSAKKTPKYSAKSLKDNSSDELSTKESNPDDGKWNELIETFDQNPNSSSHALESNFPSFSHQTESSFNSDEETTLEENKANNGYLENPLDFSTLSKRSQYEYGFFENNLSYEKPFEEEKDLKLDTAEPLLKKDLEEKDIRVMPKSQNLFYLNLRNQGPFGIGEFGDVTCWNLCKSDTIDSEKPKDHGDGAQMQKTSEIPILHEKRVSEVKTQRNLWTELKKDFRPSKPLLNKLLPETDDQVDFSSFISITIQKSKSENCIKPKVNAGNDFQSSPACKFLNEYNDMPKNTENKFLEFVNNNKKRKEVESPSESLTEKSHPSLEDIECEEEDSENQEFDCEITPRLSRSMLNFESRFQEESSFMNAESNESFSTSKTQLFEKKTDSDKYENDMTDLNIFLAPNETKNKVIIKSNWLHSKNPEKEKSREQGKKIKKKRKNISSPKEPFHEYLYSRKCRSNIPQLKLRNSNCFQNFYKRFISVFCLTSNSTSATSK